MTAHPLSRRSALLALAAVPLAGRAQAPWPAGRPIQLIVPFSAGGNVDTTARLIGQKLQDRLKQTVVIENRPGASTIIGAQAVATSPADGYTLLYTVNNTTSINPYIYKSLPYKADDFVPVIRLLSVPYVLIVPTSAPHKTLADFVGAAMSRPGTLNYASYGIGQGTHVAMAWFANAVGIQMNHVPYRDGGVTDIIAGRIDASFEPTTTATVAASTKTPAISAWSAVTITSVSSHMPSSCRVAHTRPSWWSTSLIIP